MTKNFKELVNGFQKKKILVLGDVMLDLYIRGAVDRISPEAPVPVVLEEQRKYALGGAGNVAANISSLGGKASLFGVLGNDEEGKIVRRLCRGSRIACNCFVESKKPTALKTRAMGGHHQLLRIDRESAAPVSGAIENKIIARLQREGDYDIVVVSDYNKGMTSKRITEFLKRRFGGKRIIVGAKPPQADLYKGAAVVVLNLKEAEILTGIYGENPNLASRAARELSRRFLSSVVLTRGEHGVTVYNRKSRRASHIRAKALQVYDVTGAGDTILAALALALASGSSLEEAADIANRAAGIVVGRYGTAAVSSRELLAAVQEK